MHDQVHAVSRETGPLIPKHKSMFLLRGRAVSSGKMRFAFGAAAGSVFILFSGIFTEKAYAYLDPGTGSYFFQVLMALVIGGLFILKTFWSKIVLFLAKLFPKRKKNGKT